MTHITIYHNPKCSKSRQALAYIEEAGYTPQIINYLQTPLSLENLTALVKRSGLSIHDFIRPNEALYTILALDKETDDDSLLKAIVANPILLQRPVVETDKHVIIARPAEKVLTLLRENDKP